MLWSVVMVAALGLVLGAAFRAPALIAATALTAIATGTLLDGALLPKILIPVLVLQCAYLVGLTLAGVWRRMSAGGN